MSRKMITLVMVAAFTVGAAGVSLAAKSAKCTISSIEGTTVTMDCGKNVSRLKVGEKVKVKSAKRKAVEGC